MKETLESATLAFVSTWEMAEYPQSTDLENITQFAQSESDIDLQPFEPLFPQWKRYQELTGRRPINFVQAFPDVEIITDPVVPLGQAETSASLYRSIALSGITTSSTSKGSSSAFTEKDGVIVLDSDDDEGHTNSPSDRGKATSEATPVQVCTTCQEVLTENQTMESHVRGVPHQLAKAASTASRPYYSLNERNSIGFKLLLNEGWEFGTGLGAHGTGRQQPVRVDEKHDRFGLGIRTKSKLKKKQEMPSPGIEQGKTALQRHKEGLREQRKRNELLAYLNS
ncbi:hypothetical protein DFS34DRAFT_653377 [Phlyctochytrium arcticum]|nr:hypothetical protein DFS34DRAFT_653377 [Phlyctochytrium arcticum]